MMRGIPLVRPKELADVGGSKEEVDEDIGS